MKTLRTAPPTTSSPEGRATLTGIWTDLPYLMSDAAAAEFLGVSRATFWRRVGDGTLPQPVRLGGATRWKSAELIAAIERLTKEVHDEA